MTRFLILLLILTSCFGANAEEKSISFDVSRAISQAKTPTTTNPTSYESDDQSQILPSISLPLSENQISEFSLEQIPVEGGEFVEGPDTLSGYKINNADWSGMLFIDYDKLYFNIRNRKEEVSVTGESRSENELHLKSTNDSESEGVSCGVEELDDNSLRRQENLAPEFRSPSKPSELRRIDVALTVSKSLYEAFKKNDKNVLNHARSIFAVAQRRTLSAAGLVLKLVHLGIYKEKELTILEHGKYLNKLLGRNFDAGQLLTAINPIKEFAGRVYQVGICIDKYGITGDYVGAAYTNANREMYSASEIFQHELYHQLGVGHSFSYCLTLKNAVQVDSSVESADGVSIMSYKNECGLTGRAYPGMPKDYLSSASYLRIYSQCGTKLRDLDSIEIPILADEALNLDDKDQYLTVPYLTPFFGKVSTSLWRKLRPKSGYEFFLFEPDLPLALKDKTSVPDHIGRFAPNDWVGFFDKPYIPLPILGRPSYVALSANYTVRELFCGDATRKWGLPGCYSMEGKILGQKIPFIISTQFDKTNRGIGKDLRKFEITFKGDPFGFIDNHRNQTIQSGQKNLITWSVGGGNIAKKVDIFLVSTAKMNESGVLPEGFGTLDKDYYYLAIQAPNTGLANVNVPNVSGEFYLYIQPSDRKFLFWSASKGFKLCARRGNRSEPGSCSGEECECEEEPTPTATPLPSASPSINPTVATPTATPTALPNQTITSTPTATPTETPVASPSATPSGSGCAILKEWSCRTWLDSEEAQMGGYTPICHLPYPNACDDPFFTNECEVLGGALQFKKTINSGKIEVQCRLMGESAGQWVCREDYKCDVVATLQCVRGCGSGSGGLGGY